MALLEYAYALLRLSTGSAQVHRCLLPAFTSALRSAAAGGYACINQACWSASFHIECQGAHAG